MSTQAIEQLLLFETGDRQIAKLTLRGRLAFQQLRAALVARRCGGRVANAWAWSRCLWLAEMGVDRVAVERTLLPAGLVTREGDTLVMPSLDRGPRFIDDQREKGRRGADARWGDRSSDRRTDRSHTVNERESLGLRDAKRDGQTMARARAPEISVDRSVSGSDLETRPGDPPAPSGAPSGSIHLARVGPLARTGRARAGGGGRRDVRAAGAESEGPAPAAPPEAGGQRDVRPDGVARTGRSGARLAARAGWNQGDVRAAAAGGADRGGGGPTFPMWSRRYIELTGKNMRRGRLRWDALGMSADERRTLWRFTEDTIRFAPPGWRPPNGEAFLTQHWWPELRRARARGRSSAPASTAELLGEMLGGAP
jgi:hypothetical protein